MPKATKPRSRQLLYKPYSSTSDQTEMEIVNESTSKVIDSVRQKEVVSNSSGSTITSFTDSSRSGVLSKGQKKRLEKKEKVHNKLSGIINPKKKSIILTNDSVNHEGNRKYEQLMSELEESLNTKKVKSKGNGDKSIHNHSNKKNKAIAIRETERMKFVQQHPDFIQDPIQAANAHIQMLMKSKLANKSSKLYT